MSWHTPGPWAVPHFATDHSCDCHYVLSDGQMGMGAIATVHSQCEYGESTEHNEPVEIAKANAHLIAAAPDLLEAAQGLGAMPEGYCFCSSDRIGDDSKVHEPECAELRAAIAKAKGGVA